MTGTGGMDVSRPYGLVIPAGDSILARAVEPLIERPLARHDATAMGACGM